MPEVHVVYQLKDGSQNSGDIREATVVADSLHKGEVEMAVAEHHNTNYHNVTATKWRKA